MNERRTKRRFQIERGVRYQILYGQRLSQPGTGKSLNISSSGISFSTNNLLTIGMSIRLSMNWPVLLHGSRPIRLMIYGHVIRSNDQATVVAIERYDFRLQGLQTPQPSQSPQVGSTDAAVGDA